MSQQLSLATATSHGGRGTASQQPQLRQPLLAQQQQQQQPRQRSRRPRSIHITVQKTRSGSRPVTIQRSHHHVPTSSIDHGSVASPTTTTGSSGPRSAVQASSDAYPSLTTEEAPQPHPQRQQRLSKSGHSASGGASNNVDRNAHAANEPSSSTHNSNNANANLRNSPNHAADLAHHHHARGGSSSGGDGAGHRTPAPDSASPSGVAPGTVAANSNHNNNGGGSSSSSVAGGGGGSNASVGPSSASGYVTSAHSGPQFNTFVKPPSATLQQLLPPSMRDRVNGAAPAGSSNSNSNTPAGECTGAYPASLSDLHSPGGVSSCDAGSGVGAEVRLSPQPRPHSQGPGARRTRSWSQIFPGVHHRQPSISDTTAGGAANVNGLRSNSSSHHADTLGGSYSSGLGHFVFPHPDTSTPLQQPHTPPAAWSHSSTGNVNNTSNAAMHSVNVPTVCLDSRSPRLSPPAGGGGGGNGCNRPHHQRARSYTAGGGASRYNHRGSGGPTVSAAAAGAGGVALYLANAVGSSHAESSASRNLDRSMSLSSNPAGGTASGGGGAVTNGSINNTNNGTGAGTVNTSTSTLVHHTANLATSHNSFRSGTTRETTPIKAVPITALQTPSTPLGQRQQQQQRQQQNATPNATSPPVATPTVATPSPCAVPVASLTPVPLNRSATKKSNSFTVVRSGSSDMVNGLDDSEDSVLFGSIQADTSNCDGTPRRYSGQLQQQQIHHTRGGTATAAAAAAAAGTRRYVTDSFASDSSHTPNGQDRRAPRRYSTTLTDNEEDSTRPTVAPSAAASGPSQQQYISTLERLRSRREAGVQQHTTNNDSTSSPPRRTAAAAAAKTAAVGASNSSGDAANGAMSAIERWRAQEERKRREEERQARRHRLSARQWREAFHRLEENRVKWSMRAFIGAGTSGKVYEGILEDKHNTPVAVKVLDVGVPMPVGPGAASTNSSGGHDDDAFMSPAQQEALLVLLREVEMMEKLHHANIVTCIRCQVTPVQDRYMELHHQLHHRSFQDRPASQMRPSADPSSGAQSGRGGGTAAGSGGKASNASPPRATRVPVQVEIIMELCKRGTLASVVRRSPGGQLPVVVARRYLRDVLNGLAYLHRNNFIHRDVKGENVLISASDVAKLADFGCSRRIVMTNNNVDAMLDGTMSSLGTTHAADSRYATMAEYQWCDTTGVAQTMVGTPMFMAPEIIQASGAPPPSANSTGRGNGNLNNNSFTAPAPVGYTASADIWSFGCLILEVFGRAPWPTAGNSAYHLMKQIEQSVDDLPPGVPQDTPAELLKVLRCCFLRDPHRRSTARSLLRSTWMTCADEELEEMPPRKRR